MKCKTEQPSVPSYAGRAAVISTVGVQILVTECLWLKENEVCRETFISAYWTVTGHKLA